MFTFTKNLKLIIMKTTLNKKIDACNLLIDGIVHLEEAYNGFPNSLFSKALEEVNSLRTKAEIELEELENELA